MKTICKLYAIGVFCQEELRQWSTIFSCDWFFLRPEGAPTGFLSQPEAAPAGEFLGIPTGVKKPAAAYCHMSRYQIGRG